MVEPRFHPSNQNPGPVSVEHVVGDEVHPRKVPPGHLRPGIDVMDLDDAVDGVVTRVARRTTRIFTDSDHVGEWMPGSLKFFEKFFQKLIFFLKFQRIKF